MAKAKQEERNKQLEEYYEKGDWSGEGGIEEFEKLGDPMARRPGLFSNPKVPDWLRSATKQPAGETAGQTPSN
jgi:hypothetical protein